MDHISNMLISLKNAGNAGKESVLVPHSKVKESIAKVLEKEGFIKSIKQVTKDGRKYLGIDLFLENREPRIRDVKRISKLSKRVYKGASELKPVKNGFGMLVISTPKGVMSGREAKKANLGGEVLFSIW